MTPLDLYRDMHERPDWQRDAVCAQVDPEAWFPEQGESTGNAKRVCLGCPVREQCLTYALDNDERFGVWGATSPAERAKLRRGTVVPIQRGRPLSAEKESRVRELLLEPGLTLRAIAEAAGVAEKTVRRIRDRRRRAA